MPLLRPHVPLPRGLLRAGGERRRPRRAVAPRPPTPQLTTRSRGRGCVRIQRHSRLVATPLPPSGGKYTEQAPTSQTLFELPAVAAAYERGWRQSFAWAGFPGADPEFDAAQRFLADARGVRGWPASVARRPRPGPSPGLESANPAPPRSRALCWTPPAAAASSRGASRPPEPTARSSQRTSAKRCCGRRARTSRRSAPPRRRRSRSCAATSAACPSPPPPSTRRAARPAQPGLLRLALSPRPGSLWHPQVHAGAALHCWPSPAAALTEISRVLKPGGVFVATTFLSPASILGEFVGDDTVAPLSALLQPPRGSYKWCAPSCVVVACAEGSADAGVATQVD